MVVSNDNTIVEEREEILTFHEEGEVARVPVEHPLNEQARLRDLDDVNVNDVVGILQRPVHYVDFEWSATNPDTVELVKSIPLPGDWINRSMIYDKIRGFRYLKCDFKVRVQVNAQPFNAGYLLLVFIPLHRQNQLTPTNMTSFSGLTGYPHVTLDLSESTSAELTVPYNNIITHFDLTNGIGYLGDVKLFVYSPLTGSDNVDGAVWVTAENVSISLPTGVTPKSFVFPGPTSGIAQAGSAKDSKLVTKPKGAVGKVAEGVGKVAGVLKDVPVIGSIASTVEWAADAVGGIANFFGFSKPIDQAMPQKETLIVAPNIANYDGDSKAKSLALYSKNETETPVEVFGTSEDEMSFSHIIARPVFMTRFGMKQLDKQGTIIWKWPVDPMSCEKRTYTDPGKTPYVPGQYECLNTYLSFLGGMFKYYRGSIRYHFKIVKTAFHSGRIRVFVVPGADPYTDVNRIDFNQVHSQVYDIRDTTSFDIEVPYKQNAPWKPIDARFTHAVRENIDRITPNVPTAMIYVQVINALRNPSTAAPTIDFVVSTSGAPDFQFAVPMAKHNERLIPSVESLKRDYPGGNSGYAQSGVQMLDNAGGDQLVANKIAIGEVVTGWRSLLKRYSRFLDAYPRDKFFVVAPYDSSARRDATKGPFDHFSACELLYRFKSGSIRLIARALDTKDTTVVHEITPHDSLTAQSDTLGALIQSTVLEPAMEISVPFYQETVALPTQLGSPKNQDLTTAANYSAVPFNEGTKIRSTAQMEWWRAIGEDFSFGFLVGPPTTLTDYEGRTCKWDWATEIQLLQQEEWYPLIKSELSWKDAQTKTNQLLSDAANSPFPIPELTKIVSDVYTTDNYTRYMASATDAAARQYITTLGNIVYRDALAYLGTVCIPQ